MLLNIVSRRRKLNVILASVLSVSLSYILLILTRAVQATYMNYMILYKIENIHL